MTVTMPKPQKPPKPRARWRMNKIFFEDEVEHTTPVKKNKKMVDVILSKLVVDSTGAAPGSMDAMDATTIRLMGGCRGTCKNKCVDLQTCFTPTESMNNVRSRQFFLEGVQGFKDAVQCGDADKARRWRQQAEAYKSTRCQPCRDVVKKAQDKLYKPCRDFYTQVRREECLKNDGCCNLDCPMRFSTNPLVEFMLEGDHRYTSKELDPLLRKEKALSKYEYWTSHGGVEAMKREVAKGFNWRCAFCHQLEETGKSANKFKHRNWESMPDGSRSKDATPEEKKQARAKNAAKQQCEIRYPKMEYVDEIKRTDPRFKAQCACCSRQVLPGQEHCFHFDHIVETTKLMGGWAGKDGGVAGLVSNMLKATSLTNPKFEAVLVAEIVKCRILCINCHKLKTHKRIRFRDETQEWEVVKGEEDEDEDDVEAAV